MQTVAGFTGRYIVQVGWWVMGHTVLSLHSSNQPYELSQQLCYDDNIIAVLLGS